MLKLQNVWIDTWNRIITVRMLTLLLFERLHPFMTVMQNILG